MIRILLLFLLAISFLWLVKLLRGKLNKNEVRTDLEETHQLEQKKFFPSNMIIVIIAISILAILLIYFLPRIGFPVTALIQKIIPILSYLRAILTL